MNSVEKALIAVLSSTLCFTAAQAQTNDPGLKDASKGSVVDQREPVPATPPPVEKAVEAPKPAPAPAAPKPCDFATTLASDETFASNKLTLTDSAKAKLDKDVIGKLDNCAKVRLVMVTGHTDRLGSAQSKQKLSEKHADAVKAYLVDKGVDANVLDTMGAGKTQPAQGVAKCADDLPRNKMIECLAPSRRVVIEVKGTGK